MIPLYSNYYTDFYREDTQEYHPDRCPTWSMALVDAYIGE